MKAFLLMIVYGVFMNFNSNRPLKADTIIANGQMPNVIRDKEGVLHLVYGSGDSIMYLYSKDGGKSFSKTSLIYTLPKLAASHTRGPQIAITSTGLLVTACTSMGNIFSFVKAGSGNWKLTGKVNDRDTIAKENLMALSADGANVFAVWLDLRDGHNKIFGARSSDGGKSWSKNILVYTSPDKTVCECCKPSVVMQGNNVYVMFRNWLNGNRDLYLITSHNVGKSFSKAEKLGKGSWPLNGCPMDGGAIALDKKGNPVTVWNRKGIIYTSEPGAEEREVGKGRSCTMKTVDSENVYAWLENGEVVVLKQGGQKISLGKGIQPVLEPIDDKRIICIWENDKQINSSIINL
jgi:hypothetical protein